MFNLTLNESKRQSRLPKDSLRKIAKRGIRMRKQIQLQNALIVDEMR